MEVTFTLTPEDLWQYNLYYRRHKAAIRLPLLLSLVGLLSLVCLASIVLFIYSWLYAHDPFWTIVPIIAAMIYLLPRLFPTKKRLVQQSSKTLGTLGDHLAVISPDWFFEKTSVSETKRAWAAFDSIEEDASYEYLFISKTHAYVIPKRAFTSLAEAQAFLDRARLYWNAAKTGQAVSGDAAEDTGIWRPPPRPAAAH